MVTDPQSKWQVLLRGRADDLRHLPRLSQSPAWIVFEDKATYYLTSSIFEPLHSAQAVREAAIEILTVVNASARLEFGNIQPIATDSVDRVGLDGSRYSTQFIEAIGIPPTSVVYAPEVIGGEQPSPIRPPSFSEICTEIGRDPIVRIALYFFVQPNNWAFNLWKVYEVIKDDMGGPARIYSSHKWVSKDTIHRFRTGVNERAASGDEARHVVSQPGLVPHPNPMSRAEAETFIRELLGKWLRWKYASQSEATP